MSTSRSRAEPEPRADSAPTGSRNLLGLPLAPLRRELEEWADRPFRVDQIYHAIHRRGAPTFDAITELSKQSRAQLAERYTLALPRRERSLRSTDGTVKALFLLEDGASIETVMIPDRERRTLCLSSQAGCALACRFCVTGFWGAGRNLAAHEIVGQVRSLRESEGLRNESLNLVLMGMGEPLLNLEEVHAALEVSSTVVAWRRMTVSTAGVVPGIEAMSRWPQVPNLAISLHAPDDERRSELMPINRKYPLQELLAAVSRYPTTPHRPVTFEVTLIRGFNDRIADMAAVARLLRGLHAKVNLIPLNPDPVLGDLAPPSWEHCRRLQEAVVARGVPCSVRRPRGDDVAAACGQLRAFARPPRTEGGAASPSWAHANPPARAPSLTSSRV